MRPMKVIILIALVLFLTGGTIVYAISRSAPIKKADSKLTVVTSFYPLYYFATQIGGDKATIVNLTPAGAEPHDYDPSTQDIAKISQSNLLILNGGLETWGNKIRDILQGSTVVIVTAGQSLFNQQVTENNQAQVDPHVWLDPLRAKQEAAAISQGFIKADSTNAAYYQANEQKLDQQFYQLNADYTTGLKSCQQKNIVTSHAAFGYLASRYGLTQVPIAGLSPDAEPSAKQLADIATFVKANHIHYIFFESLVSPKLAQTIASATGAQTLVLNPLEGVSQTDMQAGQNYFTIMEENLKNLETALQCTT